MNFLVTLSNDDFSELEKDFQVIKFDKTNTAFVICENEDIEEIRKLDNFVSVFPEAVGSASQFKAGL